MAVTESVRGDTSESAGARAVHEGILRRQSARESAARTYARALPIVPVRARGLTIEGADGRRYLDCLSGAGTLALGHNHPVVLEAIRKVLDSGAPLHVLDLATPVKDAFITELFRTLPPGLADHARVQFCGPAGTDAVEAAFKLVRAATGRTGILAFSGAYHGMTAGALEASGGAFDVRVARLPFPQDYRCPFGVGGERGAELAARWTESVLEDPKSGVPHPAGMILEPVQGEGGVIPAPDGWLRRMRQITADRSIPLIADEVQTGVGRTGAFWAVEHSGVTPDVMVLSKAIGGSLPLAVIVYRDELDAWQPGAHAGTFRGNQLAMAAGTATLAYVRENRLAERAAELGSRMLRQLQLLAGEFACIGDVRGRGLMIGVEVVEPQAQSAPAEGRPAGLAVSVGAGSELGALAALEGRGGVPGQDEPGASAALDWPGDGTAGGLVGRAPARTAGAFSEGVVPVGGGATAEAAQEPDSPPRPAAPDLAAAVQRECLRRGLIVELGGRHSSVVRLLPPLTISDEQAEAVLDRLADAVDAVSRGRSSHTDHTGHSGQGQMHQRHPGHRMHGDRADKAG
ncbi:2,4-diaminobutyrate 4-aminotransferase [Streptomyces viridochromogenes]|uniref:Diaminobutyrate--2-oxoglutarate transaminase n=1 Tax=Streptomyces viridochromogenes TaxID=1938 RepID=A0A0J7ZKW4_STRVR|nr:diaminobutyrate--2-oxoglutarate transaminase family protein [Streptomyces viridochromogenes]KMS76062.1 2,4-diaminobutyrate 4-aminotransferase [Streptomyces viridochromogenes]KOG07640.1 2,4-diaminobutyrate 4-aminotransferase [Streptomyces viridochromogenes]KOG12781.1 2,4-diaminobutyrate 4-aminotransferase [Streptomyces viridochromogenes]